MPVRRFAAACLTLITVAACSRSTPELTSPPPSAKASETAEAMGAKAPAATEPTGGGGGGGHSETPAVPTPLLTPGATDETPSGTPGADPLNGTFTLADAAKDLKGSGPLVATLDTTSGALTCTLYEDKAPNTVANFIGLARGTRPWKDASGTWVKRPAYNATSFHRVIKGFMIQGGDFRGNGTGEPGYVIKDEIWEGAKHDRAGLLCMANRGPDTNGAQFFITDAVTPHLDGGYTIFGECAPEATVHAIAGVPVNGSSPKTPVLIKKVTIARSPQSGK